MAAALLAALFAMGVFAPVGVDAEVRNTPKPTAVLSSTTPEAEDVTLTLMFELSAAVDGTTDGANVVIGIPTTITASVTAADYDADNVSVTQGGQEVGSVTITDNTVTIGEPAADSSNGRLEAGVMTTVTISGLELEAAPATGNVNIAQTSTNARDVAIAIHGSVTEALVELESTDDSDEPKGDYEAGAPVKMTITVMADTAAANAAASNIVITLPSDYDLDTDGDADTDTDSGGIVKRGNTVLTDTASTVAATLGDVISDNTITIGTLAADTSLTLEITGLTNPGSSAMYSVGFKQGVIPAAVTEDLTADPPVIGDPMYNETAMFYITELAAVDVAGRLAPGYAGATNAMLSLEFGSVVDLSMMNDSEIMIELIGGLSMSQRSTVSVMQMHDRNEAPVDVGGNVMVNGNTITIMHDDGEDANNVMKTMGRNVGKVMVEITGLTNPSNDGPTNVFTVTQDEYQSITKSFNFSPALVEPNVDISADTAGAAVNVNVYARAMAAIRGGTDIDITLPDFGTGPFHFLKQGLKLW